MNPHAPAASTTPVDPQDPTSALTVPGSPRAHLAFDRFDARVASRTYRVFMPLVDPGATEVLPVFGYWWFPGGLDRGGEVDAGRPMTVAAAVEADDGSVVPFTFDGGGHTATFPGGAGGGAVVVPDEPRSVGAQVRTTSRRGEPVSGFWLRTWVSADPPRVDGCRTASGSPAVADAAVVAEDRGRTVRGPGVPEGSFVGTVVAGVSFLLSSSPTTQSDVPAEATRRAVDLELGVPVPLNLGTQWADRTAR